MLKRFVRRIVFGAWLLAVLMPALAPARPSAARAPEVAPGAAPSCVRQDSWNIHCFVIGDDQRVWQISWSLAHEWGAWRLVGAPANAQIDREGGVAAVMRGAQIDLFVVAHAGGYSNLYHLNGSGSAWGVWENLSGPPASAVSKAACLSYYDIDLECFVLTDSNAVWRRRLNGTAWAAWGGAGPPFPEAAGRPVSLTAVGTSGNLMLFVIGGDGRSYHVLYTTPLWYSWIDDGAPTGTRLAQISCTVPGQNHCAYSDVSGHVWQRTCCGSDWSVAIDLGAPPASATGVTISLYGDTGLLVLSSAADGHIYRRARNPGASTWSDWADLGRPQDVRVFIPAVVH
jgi:hypothetical protein